MNSPAAEMGTKSSDLAALPLVLYLHNQISSLQILPYLAHTHWRAGQTGCTFTGLIVAVALVMFSCRVTEVIPEVPYLSIPLATIQLFYMALFGLLCNESLEINVFKKPFSLLKPLLL